MMENEVEYVYPSYVRHWSRH